MRQLLEERLKCGECRKLFKDNVATLLDDDGNLSDEQIAWILDQTEVEHIGHVH